ncbi:monosaccharide-sensing protein 2-like [Oryza brachyantha]|uniref:monosaccharide-sensing protein 2-like n=1 Tax=Oryza brachyantha TaxID=4533 RepID=UPI001ADA3F2E|nr:monosaccharide-sensing protein 2-like [Oryza brachyantha]
MRGAVVAAAAAALGNMLQGWDNATIAGALLYIRRDLPALQAHPALQGLVVATSLIGATIVTTLSGPLSDYRGRRPMLVASALLYSLAGLLMLWSPTVEVLLLARLVDGFAIGLAVTLVPVYISETAPPDTRGLLNTLPQLTGSTGMFLSYCMVFVIMLAPIPNWHIMLGVLLFPALLYLLVTVLYLPESPRWLVSKGRMKEARAVLQMLRGRQDVSAEMALLVEGLTTGRDTAVEEYVVGPLEDGHGEAKVMLYEPERRMSGVAPGSVFGSTVTLASRQGSMLDHLKDPVVALLDSLHDMKPPAGGMDVVPNLGSMIGVHDRPPIDWDEESAGADDGDIDAPLLGLRRHSSLSIAGEATSTLGIGGGWQLAWKWTEVVAPDGTRQSTVKRMYLHEEQGDAAEEVHAAALVSQSASCTRQDDLLVGPALAHPAETEAGAGWRELLEPGVRHALVCGVAIQILQQFSGISGVLFYTPQILEQAGVDVLLSRLGLRADSASILISGLTTLLMLPSIGVAMRLMDASGRRSLLLWTIPVLIASLAALVVASVAPMAAAAHAALCTGSVVVYLCCFVMGFGPIPNILCAEIFPTRVRGLCIAICSLAFWLADIAVTYSLPVMLSSLGLAGVFAIYAAVCCVALAFVALRVPETKGLPLEVIIDFFNVGAKGTLPNLHHDEDDED